MLINPFVPGSTQNVSTGGASAEIALASENDSVRIENYGTNPCYIKLGFTGVTATTSDMVVRAGSTAYFYKGNKTALAHLQITGATTLSITTGTGGC